jgi:hypothetical protein
MPNASFRVVGVPDTFDPLVEHLWALIGGGDNHDGGQCFYLLPTTHLATGPTIGEALIPARDRINAAGFLEITESDLYDASRAYQAIRHRKAT